MTTKRGVAKIRLSPHSNRIPLPFEKIVEGMLAVEPEKKPTRRKKKPPEAVAAIARATAHRAPRKQG